MCSAMAMLFPQLNPGLEASSDRIEALIPRDLGGVLPASAARSCAAARVVDGPSTPGLSVNLPHLISLS